MSCKNCKSRSLKKIIPIGKQPISSHFYKKKMYNLKNYSLDLYICNKCGMIARYNNNEHIHICNMCENRADFKKWVQLQELK